MMTPQEKVISEANKYVMQSVEDYLAEIGRAHV